MRRYVKQNSERKKTYDHVNHDFFVHVGEKVNYYEHKFNAMIALNKSYGCSELLRRNLDCTRGRMLHADVVELAIAEEKTY